MLDRLLTDAGGDPLTCPLKLTECWNRPGLWEWVPGEQMFQCQECGEYAVYWKRWTPEGGRP